MKNSIYEELIDGLPEDLYVDEVCCGVSWISARLSSGGVGTAAGFDGKCDCASFSGEEIRKAALAVYSDDQRTAAAGMSVINAYYNSPSRLSALGAAVSCETFCTDGLALEGKTVGMIGHMSRTAAAVKSAAERLWIFELNPRDGDLDASEEEALLPKCDLVIVTASALINHTLPRILELSSQADVILLGPTAPMCPLLLNFGISRINGMVVTKPDEFIAWNRQNGGSPMTFCTSYII